MPAYDFECTGCGHVFEVIRPITDDGFPVCPECGWSITKKIITAPGQITVVGNNKGNHAKNIHPNYRKTT